MPNQFTIPYDVEELFLALYQGVDLILKLGITNITPGGATVLGNYTEASGGGYAEIAVDGGDWTLEANAPRDIILAQQSVVFTGPLDTGATVYTWYLVDAATELVYWGGKKLDTPFTPAVNGDTLKFTPRIQAGNGTPT